MFIRFARPAARLVLLVLVAAVSVLVGDAAQAPPPERREIVNGHEAVAGEVLVKFRGAQTAAERAQLHAQLDLDRDSTVNSAGVRHLRSRAFDSSTLVAFFRGSPNVEYAEPNYILHAIQTPNDPQFGQLWGLLNLGQVVNGSAGLAGADIAATQAWDVSTGSRANVVGVVDTGVDYTHQDLAANIWSAPSIFTVTIGGTSITCAAGTHGFNAITNTCNPMDDNNHGTHVSGTIGASGNNGVGITGVNQAASIMGLKFLSASGSGSTVDAIELIEFAIQAKSIFGAAANVRVLSNSWGGGGYSQALLDEINKANANDMLFVAAAGNSNLNNNVYPFYPANYAAPNIIAVAATTSMDGRASFSNYGATTVDLGAPGVNILSTTIGNTYSLFNGTSMATPHVSGAAALVLSVCALNTAALKATILNTVDPVGALAGITVTGGRLNVNSALAACAGPPPPPPTAPLPPTGLTAAPGNARVTLNWTGSAGAASYNVKRSTISGGEVTIASATGTSYVDMSVANGTRYYYTVSAVNPAGESGNSNEASATPTAPPAPPAPTNLTASNAPNGKKITLYWSASAGATSYRVKRSSTSGGPYTVIASPTGTSYGDTGMPRGTSYYVVSAVNAGGESGNSNQASGRAR